MLPLPLVITFFASLTVAGGFLGWRWPRATAMLALGWLVLLTLAAVIYAVTTGRAEFSLVRSAANLLMELSRYASPILLGAFPLTLGKLITTRLRNQSVKR